MAKAENPYIRRDGDQIVITEDGKIFLDSVITNTESNVYAFKSEANPLLAAAAMARLSRRGSDLREIYLDEFAISGTESADALIDRVVVGYGDDSVSQLINVALVVEGASNLLTKKLERGRLRNYLEQSTRYIFFDKRDANGNYPYYVPNLPESLLLEYRKDIDAIFNLYSHMVRNLTDYLRKKIKEPENKIERSAWLAATKAQACDAVRPVLPVATKSTVGIVGSAQSIEEMILFLLSEPLNECQDTGKKVLLESRKVVGSFLKRADMPDRGLAKVLYRTETMGALKEIAGLYIIGDGFSDVSYPAVTLLKYGPEDELSLAPRMFFEGIGRTVAPITLRELERQSNIWPRDFKEQIFHTYIGNRLNRRHKPGRALEAATYEWEIIGDYGTFRDLQRHRLVSAFEWPNLTTMYGYEVPELIVEAGLESQFRKCFEISESLFNKFLALGLAEEAQYVTLLGHKLPYTFIENAREAFHIHELRTGPQGHPGYRKIVQEMHNVLCKVHPRLGSAMKFVNMGEDPELARLAAERVNQSKLAALGLIG